MIEFNCDGFVQSICAFTMEIVEYYNNGVPFMLFGAFFSDPKNLI